MSDFKVGKVGIQEIASYLPERQVHARELKARFDLADGFLEEKIGVESFRIKSSAEETSDLCVKAFRNLPAKTRASLDPIEVLVVCTQNPDAEGIPHTSAIVHGKLGLPDSVACFDISLGCSGYVYGLSVVTAFMESHRIGSGLLFTADPYSKIVDPADRDTALLFGDGATVTKLGLSPAFRIRAARFGTRGRDGGALTCEGGKLVMNGRSVFSFAMSTVPGEIQALMQAEGLTSDQIDLFLLHQGSKYIVEQLAKRLNLRSEQAPVRIQRTGNTVSSSIPLLLEEYLPDPSKRRILACGFGVGLSWATAILERTPEG